MIKNLPHIYRKITRKWCCAQCLRNKSSTELKTKTYSNTILFPKTNFPARTANLHRKDIAKNAQFSELYHWQRDHAIGPEFVLHDGPPYANGDLHMGHAVNKIIKDICNRVKVLEGYKVHYIPGWDCHGLPIELKALQSTQLKAEVSNAITTRRIARNFALETIKKQKATFESWGVMADWNDKYYLTMSKSYVANQLRQFYKMFQSKLIFRALKPVYWSPSSRTALAEAELEYDPQYRSREVYVEFPFNKVPENIKECTKSNKLYALIWTTTPWTLIANRAVCFNSELNYSLVRISSRQPENVYVVLSSLIDTIEKVMNVNIERITEFNGAQLNGATYTNTLLNRTFPFLDSTHVTDSKGTGLVHCAPAHGPDDFKVGLNNDMIVECNVDESGCYFDIDPKLDGLFVLKEGQDEVISLLGDAVHYQGTYVHSYPLDWRTKKPVIIRASQQWFIDTGALKTKALEVLKDVVILPQASSEQYRQGLQTQLEKRPYWCISRQRSWGSPIPVLYANDRAIVDERIVERLCRLIEEQGTDVWWTCSVQDLIPEDVAEEYDLKQENVTKGSDILDIWLDSGLTWSGVLNGKQAEVYVEGVDQFTGWFQSSLLTSVALRNKAPYKSILVHGFVVDDKRRKMSKSLGNVIDPATIVQGGKDKNKDPQYGIDTLRWWVASHGTQHSQIIISKKLIDDCQGEVIRIRNIFKYLLGVVNDLEWSHFDKQQKLNYFDRYMISETENFANSVQDFYNNFKFNHACQMILYFISNRVSALYCHCVKDRLYCSRKDSEERLNAQMVLHTVLVTLSKSLAPILPHLVEEVWNHHPLYERPFFFTRDIPILSASRDLNEKIMDTLLDMKKDLCSVTKNENLRKFEIDVTLNTELFDELNMLSKTDVLSETDLCEIFEVSDINIFNSHNQSLDKRWKLNVRTSDKNQCLRCRKYNALINSDKCERCERVMLSM